MRKLLGFLCFILLVFGLVGTTSATPFLDVNGDHTGFVWMGQFLNPSETWIFDLDNDSLDMGDINSGDKITSATLQIKFWDIGDLCDIFFLESTDLSIDSSFIKNFEVDAGIYEQEVLAYVDDHILNVTLGNLSGSFCWPANFWVCEMSVSGEYTPVPEPATILLLSLGLGGLAGFGLKRFRNRWT